MVASVLADTRSLGQFNVYLQLSSARAVTTTNLNAAYYNGLSNNGVGARLTALSNGALVVDGVTINESERLLVNGQTNAAFNGVYIMEQEGDAGEPWILQRADDFQVTSQMRAGLFIPIDQGVLLAGSIWILDDPVPNYVGVDAITFTNAAGASPQEVTPEEIQQNAFIYAVNSGPANAYAIALDPVVSAYTDGLGVIMKVLAADANTAASTLAVNGLAAVPIYLPGGLNLNAADISGGDYHLVYSSTYNGFMILNPNTAGQVASGLINQLAYYAASGDTVSGLATANNGTLVTSNTGAPSILAGPGTTGNILQSNAAAAPSYSTATYPSVATSSGTILRANGTNWLASTATFADTYAVSTILYASGANAVTGLATANSASLVTSSTGVPTWSSSMTDGQIIIGSTGATPTAATLTAGANIAITNGAGSITIAGSGFGAFTWNDVTGVAQTIAVNNGYIANNAGLVTLTLPTTAAVGTVFAVQGSGAGGWSIAQNANQILHVGSSASTTGVGGSVASTNRYDSIYFVCIVADLEWACIGGPQGILTVT